MPLPPTVLAYKPRDWTPRPEVLLLPNIPKPMHGMPPRVILGDKWWRKTRKEAYASTNFHCIACEVHKSKAKARQWLEGHELFETDYKRGRLTYIETVPLCHYCHNYIHDGRLKALLDRGEVHHAKYAAILRHGDEVLARNGLSKPLQVVSEIVKWEDWRLVLDGEEYPPVFATYLEWLAAFSGRDDG